MIELIRGPIIKKMPTFCVVESSGIGIGVHISLQTFQKIGSEGEPVELLTYLHVREDALQLYGFSQEEERDAFRKLINVSGIGPRLALTILSGLSLDEFRRAVVTEDYEVLTRIPGVGKKTAQRVVLELKEKITVSAIIMPQMGVSDKEKFNEAMKALITLGYKQPEAKNVIESVLKKYGNEISLEEIIKFALQEM